MKNALIILTLFVLPSVFSFAQDSSTSAMPDKFDAIRDFLIRERGASLGDTATFFRYEYEDSEGNSHHVRLHEIRTGILRSFEIAVSSNPASSDPLSPKTVGWLIGANGPSIEVLGGDIAPHEARQCVASGYKELLKRAKE